MIKCGALRTVLVVMLLLASNLGMRAETAAPVADQLRAATPSTVTVFAAASLKTALDIIGKAWTAETGHTVVFSYAASSAIAKQIEQGAPADIFVSADLKWMDYLAERKLIAPETRINLLGNTLVLIAPAGSTAEIEIEKGFKLSDLLGEGKLATGDPKSVPAGAYAEASLKSLGVWESVAPRIAGAENVRAALAFVARKEAPFGIVYGSDAKSEPQVKIVDVFPEESHPPIVYPIALVSTSKSAEAKRFLSYLSEPAASAVFEAQGFEILN